MLKKTLIAVALLFVLSVGTVLAIAASRPEIFRVVRSAEIAAPPERVYPFINNLKAWREWSAYEQKDPDMQRTYSGPESGVGAKYAWDGDDNIGAGSFEITEAEEPRRVQFALDFTRPFECHNVAIFTLEPTAGGTRVTWEMEGPSQFMANVISVFIDMDQMVGADFEAGLANLKRLAEQDEEATDESPQSIQP
jgi:uncharacterized protein YndB with AHSA1/START domain